MGSYLVRIRVGTGEGNWQQQCEVWVRASQVQRTAKRRQFKAIAEVRAQVPAARRAEFDELLGEGRLTCSLRDERGV
jgi:hypothetical protein